MSIQGVLMNVLIFIAQENKNLLVQMYYQRWIMLEGRLVYPGTNWVWWFHRIRHRSVTRRCSWTVECHAQRKTTPPEGAQTRPSGGCGNHLAQPQVDGVKAIRTAMGCLSRTLTGRHKKADRVSVLPSHDSDGVWVPLVLRLGS